MFIGTYYHTLEEKGRLSLPKLFRQQNEKWVITRGLDGGLFVFTASEFAAQTQQLLDTRLTRKSHRDFARLFTNEAVEVQPDSLGRVQLPEYLIKFAQLTKEVVIVGSFNRLEIWDRELYHQYMTQLEGQAEQIAESIDAE